MGKEKEREVLLALVKQNWPSGYGPVAYPNAKFTPPANARWASVEIVTLSTERASLSRDFFKRTTGILQFDLYVPEGLGTKEAREVADFLEDFFQDLVVPCGSDVIVFETPRSKTLPTNVVRAENLDDNWYRYVVECPFRRDSRVIK